jgi:purine-binding chemotaxis protein CheW
MIIPVIDLRRRFMVGGYEYLPTTVVIVLRHECDEEQRFMGLVVDAVSDVISQGTNELVAPMGDSIVTPFIQSLLNVDDQVMSLLDTQELLNMHGILRETA